MCTGFVSFENTNVIKQEKSTYEVKFRNYWRLGDKEVGDGVTGGSVGLEIGGTESNQIMGFLESCIS